MWNNLAMIIAKSKITAQGQISVPFEIRKKLGLAPGSVLEWEEDGENIVVKRAVKYSSQDIHNALFPKKPKPRSLSDLKDAIAQDIRNRHAKR